MSTGAKNIKIEKNRQNNVAADNKKETSPASKDTDKEKPRHKN